jgi:hypothetical protein
VLEDFFNSDTSRLVDALRKMRGRTALCDLGVLDSTTLNGGPLSAPQRNEHLMQDWFGMRWDAKSASWKKQAAFNAKTNAHTGYWRQWYGDCEKIVRTTLIRAAEVALGLGHGDTIPDGFKPNRHWPVQFLWKCSQPWFEGWITWRSLPNQSGMVTVVFCTPGQGDPVLTSPLSPPQRNLPDYAFEPTSCAAAEGMWVVAHADEEVHYVRTTAPTASGQWVYPHFGPVYVGKGDVVTVQPSEPDGGVLSGGRQWVP